MDDNLFAYIERLELLAFFSGYPLVYAFAIIIAGNKNERSELRRRLFKILPFAYALTGTLYLGMVIKNAYPAIDFEVVFNNPASSWLRIWGFSSVLFWLPVFARIPILSLLHSLVFFFFIVRDLVIYVSGANSDNHLIKNDMKVYGDSILINIAAIVLCLTFYALYIGMRRSGNSGKP